MPELNLLAILLAGVVAFVISGAYYAPLGTRMAKLSPAYAEPGRSAAATTVVELVRNVVLAVVVAGLVASLGLGGLSAALLLALALWVAFPVVLLAGAVFHERVPPLLAVIHVGDWLLKLAVITAIVTLWL